MQILTTKLFIPPLRSRLVPRERLIQKLNQGKECGLILVSAPAGYGKTTLLSAWIDQLRCDKAWVSLDDEDNDPARFITYLCEALRTINPTIDDVAESAPDFHNQSEGEAMLPRLINRISQSKRPLYLVLDDYHTIQSQDIHHIISYLLEHRPPLFHLVIGTRADPPLPLAKLRGRSELLELRMMDLRFTFEEAGDFLRHTMGLQIDAEDATSLTKRTEGWIAGLQIAALSLQSTDDIPGFISAFTGSHHYIFDYLVEEILKKQSVEIRRFLLCTSILDQLTDSLCDAVLNNKIKLPSHRRSSVILDELEHANLFIMPVDQDQRWYRYHPLFAELLRSTLKKNHADQVSTLHTRASMWFESQGMIAEAIRHTFAAGNWERMVRLVSANIFALLEQNELNSVARQLENLPSEKSSARPWLLIGRAWLAAYTGQLKTVEPILKLLETEVSNLSSEVELQTFGGHIAAIRAYANWIGDKREVAMNAAQVALEWLPANERLIRCQAATLLGLTAPDYDRRTQAFEQALENATKCNVSHVTIFALGCWAWHLVMHGKLREARSACLEAIQLAQSSKAPQSIPTLSHVYTTLSFVLCEWNELEAAIRYSKEAVQIARQWEQADALHFALDNLGYALYAAGDTTGAFDVMHQAWQVARRTSRWFEEITIAQEVGWDLSQGSLMAAIQCLQQAGIEFDDIDRIPLSSYKSNLMPMTFIRIYIAQKEYSKALGLLEPLVTELERKKIYHFVITLLIWQALAYQGLEQGIQALDCLDRAMALAEPEGYLRLFIGQGPELTTLLHRAREAGTRTAYIDHLLSFHTHDSYTQKKEKASSIELIEPLTERELEVLQLLAEGYADKKIADQLVIARETVHKHLKNIYGKLDVHSRTEAIVRAHDLSLL